MPKVVRKGDKHSCGSVDIGGSNNVFVNNCGVHRKGDVDSHGGVQVDASPNVFANGINIARIGDNNSGCPSPPHPPNPEVTGSPDTYVNE